MVERWATKKGAEERKAELVREGFIAFVEPCRYTTQDADGKDTTVIEYNVRAMKAWD